ncbi:MAG: hypothetical protein ABL995_13270 [Bryobacteraceae bacterium]
MRKVYAPFAYLFLTHFLMMGKAGAQMPPISSIQRQDSLQQERMAFVGDRMISVARLRHKVLTKALAAHSRAWKHARAGAWELSAIEFRKAIAIDPEYSDAHGNLGAVCIFLNRMDESAVELRRAIELDPYSSGHRANLAIVYTQLKRYSDAEKEAMAALALDSSSVPAHYLIGVLLANKPAERENAIPHLQYAARFTEDGRQALAELYDLLGQPELAQEQQRLLAKADALRKEGSTHGR